MYSGQAASSVLPRQSVANCGVQPCSGVALPLRELRDRRADDLRLDVADRTVVDAGRRDAIGLAWAAGEVVRRVDHATREPGVERPAGAVRAAGADRVREPLLHGVARGLRLPEPREREAEEVGAAAPVDGLDLLEQAIHQRAPAG